MNIFFLDQCPATAAGYLVDRHVVKMILEAQQMLDIAHRVAADPYVEVGHKNHPCSVWVRQNTANYEWLLNHALAIGAEYTRRYYGRKHSSELVVRDRLMQFPRIPFSSEISPPALAMPEQYRSSDPVKSYREYYIHEKRHLFKWKNTPCPPWIASLLHTV